MPPPLGDLPPDHPLFQTGPSFVLRDELPPEDDDQPVEVRFFPGPPIPISELLRQRREEEAAAEPDADVRADEDA